MKTLLKVGWIGAFACGALVYPAAAIIGSGAVEAWRITPHAKETVEVKRALEAPAKGEPDFAKKVMQLYGIPSERPILYVFVPKEKFFHPEEMPELTLLPVDTHQKENPFELRKLQFFRPWVTGGAAVTGLVLLGVWALLRRRARRASP